MSRLIATLMILTALSGAAARADTMYIVQDLGTLAGPNGSCSPNGMNSNGQVTGDSDDPVAGTGLAFIWTAPGPMQSLGTLPGAASSDGLSINAAGWVCGQSDGEAFVYSPQNGMQSAGYLGSGTGSELDSINDAGVAVGGSTTLSNSRANAMIWDPTNGLRDLNSMIVNPPVGWTPTGAILINNNGLIAGIGAANINTSPPSGAEHAFTLSNGSLTEIPNPSTGGYGIYPKAMNASGEVVGFYNGSNAFEYTLLGGTRDIGNLGGAITEAFGVNDQGTIVGTSELPNGSEAAFLYTDAGGMVDLNTLAPVNGWTLDGAFAINDAGQIAAEGYNGSEYHAFLLTPTPEPSTLHLLIAFACFLLILHLCRRRLVSWCPRRPCTAPWLVLRVRFVVPWKPAGGWHGRQPAWARVATPSARASILFASLTIIAALCATPASADTMYTVTDLGNIGGDGVYPNAINSYGQVTGTAASAVPGTGYAFLWTAPGPMISLGALGSPATQSSGNSINDSGWIVGQSNSEAFLYTPQMGMQGLGFLSGGTSSVLYSINNSNVAVGGSGTAGSAVDSAMIWDPTNGMRDLNSMIVNPAAGWTPTAATAISQTGLIVGIGSAGASQTFPPPNQHAFVLSGGSMTVIPELGVDTQPASINSSGEVVGTYFDANNQQHGFVYTAANGIRDIGNLGGSIVDPTFVSDQGLVLGGSELADGSSAAFLYTDAGGMVNLNTLAPIDGWTLYYAAGMNQNGQIICAGTNGHGSDAFLLTPTPEPSTYCLLIAAFCFLLISQLCRRRMARL